MKRNDRGNECQQIWHGYYKCQNINNTDKKKVKGIFFKLRFHNFEMSPL